MSDDLFWFGRGSYNERIREPARGRASRHFADSFSSKRGGASRPPGAAGYSPDGLAADAGAAFSARAKTWLRFMMYSTPLAGTGVL